MTPFSRPWLVPLALALPALLAGCDKPVAIGDSNNIVVAAPDSVWAVIRDDVTQALQPEVFTVRDEPIFEVTQVDPRSPEWGQLRHIRQVLVVGEPGDPWVAEALEEAEGAAPSPPALVQARNVWAQNQLVTALVVPPASGPAAAGALVGVAGDTLVEQFTRYARSRMFVTGVDSVRADSLARQLGFSLRVPRVYRVGQPAADQVVFRNDNPDPSQLIREIDVAWRPREQVELTPETALEWRAELAGAVTQPPQVTEPGVSQVRRLTVNGHAALEVQGVWSNPPGDWPAAGPFIARLVQCPERTYLLNAWLYAPGTAKYEYMVQLETLLDSFRCTT